MDLVRLDLKDMPEIYIFFYYARCQLAETVKSALAGAVCCIARAVAASHDHD
jgi:hypothetical protein